MTQPKEEKEFLADVAISVLPLQDIAAGKSVDDLMVDNVPIDCPHDDWIPATILPENTNYGHSDKMFVCQFAPGDFGPTRLLAKYDFFRQQWRTAIGQVRNVTCWQPMPALPKEYTNES